MATVTILLKIEFDIDYVEFLFELLLELKR